MRLFPGFFNVSERFVGPRPNECSLDRLTNDILVDSVIPYLEVADILRLRKVSKLYYELTHKPIIWKRLLRSTHIPLPPLPPTIRNTSNSMSGLEAERLLVRAYSLHKNWKSPSPKVFRKWCFDADYRVLEMALLPGGQYLVASVTHPGESRYSLVVYTMDTLGSARAVAAIDTGSKAYSIQAKYMNIYEKDGIAIAFLRRNYHHKTDRRLAAKGHRLDASQYSTYYDIASDVEFRYECGVMHVPLENLEYLNDIPFPSDSGQYRNEASSLDRPFKNLVLITTCKELRSPVLAEMFGAPYVAVAKGNNGITFKMLCGGAPAVLTCIDQPTAAQLPHRIKAIHLLPNENAVLVVREVATHRTPTYVFEKFPALRCGEKKREQRHVSLNHTVAKQLGHLTHVHIPDIPTHTQSTDFVIDTSRSSSISKLPPSADVVSDPPHPLCIYAHRKGEEMIIRVMFYPKRILVPLHASQNAPLGAPESMLTQYPPSPDAFVQDAPNPPVADTPKFRVTYEYSLEHGKTIKWNTRNPNVNLRIIPAHQRPLLYNFNWDDRSDAPLVLNVQPLIDRGWEVRGPRQLIDDVFHHPTARIASPPFGAEGPSDLGLRVSAFAWDETIGRLIVAEEGKSEVIVYDFADAPRQDANKERYPIPIRGIPDPDVPMRPCERPSEVSFNAEKRGESQRHLASRRLALLNHPGAAGGSHAM